MKLILERLSRNRLPGQSRRNLRCSSLPTHQALISMSTQLLNCEQLQTDNSGKLSERRGENCWKRLLIKQRWKQMISLWRNATLGQEKRFHNAGVWKKTTQGKEIIAKMQSCNHKISQALFEHFLNTMPCAETTGGVGTSSGNSHPETVGV